MKLTKKQLYILRIIIMGSSVFAYGKTSQAMHIMEGYLPAIYCIAWGVLCIPFLVAGFMKMNNLLKEDRKLMVILAMAGASTFVLSALKIPSVTGSCSHMTGTGLCAILFGPCITAVLGLIVLIFQAILLAHGGITTLGANTFSMAIAGPILSWLIWNILKRTKFPKGGAIFLAAALGDIFTYCVTSFQLGIAYPSQIGGVEASILKFLGVFAPTQLTLAIVEGILTYIIMTALGKYAESDMRSLGILQMEGRKK